MATLNLKIERLKAGISQEDLAKKAGTTKQNVCNWEHGRNKPSYPKIKILSEIFKKPIDYLFEEVKTEKSTATDKANIGGGQREDTYII